MQIGKCLSSLLKGKCFSKFQSVERKMPFQSVETKMPFLYVERKMPFQFVELCYSPSKLIKLFEKIHLYHHHNKDSSQFNSDTILPVCQRNSRCLNCSRVFVNFDPTSHNEFGKAIVTVLGSKLGLSAHWRAMNNQGVYFRNFLTSGGIGMF